MPEAKRNTITLQWSDTDLDPAIIEYDLRCKACGHEINVAEPHTLRWAGEGVQAYHQGCPVPPSLFIEGRVNYAR